MTTSDHPCAICRNPVGRKAGAGAPRRYCDTCAGSNRNAAPGLDIGQGEHWIARDALISLGVLADDIQAGRVPSRAIDIYDEHVYRLAHDSTYTTAQIARAARILPDQIGYVLHRHERRIEAAKAMAPPPGNRPIGNHK